MTVYLDNAATSYPKPQIVIDETMRCMRDYCGNPGRGSHSLSLAASEVVFSVREKLDRLFNGYGPEYCVFTLNTTYALNIALKSLVDKGCHVLISDMEHNSVLRQVTSLERDHIITFDIFRTFGGNVDRLIKDLKTRINKKTSIIICQHVSNICGTVLPLERIGKLCRSFGIKLIVDAAQSAGLYDIDIKKFSIDALCIPSHKSLYGPQGAGAVLYSGRITDKIRTFVEGGSGSDSLNPYMPSLLPDRLEAGTLPTPSIAGWSQGIDYIMSNGISEMRRHEFELSNKLTLSLLNDNSFVVYEPNKCGNSVLFNVNGKSPDSVSNALNNAGICTRAGFHCAPLAHKTLCTGNSGAIRSSFGIYNTKKDIDILLDELNKIKKSVI